MDNDLDLTLKLGLPNSTVETNLSLNTSTTTSTITTDQDTNDDRREDNNNNDGGRGDKNNNGGGEVFNLCRAIWGDNKVSNDEGARRSNVDMNIRVYNYIFQQFAGAPNTLNFDTYPMPPPPGSAPAPVTRPEREAYVLIDVPASRAQRNNAMLMANAWSESPSSYGKRLRVGCDGGYCGGRAEGPRKCTNKNCNALTTPMWRRGPLGPKSLCNACGIKFRKEQERKAKRN
ncbi:hypothetical protein CARUB_v10016445mg [Capsella rubella]|uniref:GATA-type domain-containing protein n=1 Tax=Capsella rubella TaxID=81985 RepID=R0GBK1_9BRAS|nr:GATA transcription factor 29 [Capsella rubella]EOA33107.1 hypothetical protein CARUB_v10016445mg [Capsella rubella]